MRDVAGESSASAANSSTARLVEYYPLPNSPMQKAFTLFTVYNTRIITLVRMDSIVEIIGITVDANRIIQVQIILRLTTKSTYWADRALSTRTLSSIPDTTGRDLSHAQCWLARKFAPSTTSRTWSHLNHRLPTPTQSRRAIVYTLGTSTLNNH